MFYLECELPSVRSTCRSNNFSCFSCTTKAPVTAASDVSAMNNYNSSLLLRQCISNILKSIGSLLLELYKQKTDVTSKNPSPECEPYTLIKDPHLKHWFPDHATPALNYLRLIYLI